MTFEMVILVWIITAIEARQLWCARIEYANRTKPSSEFLLLYACRCYITCTIPPMPLLNIQVCRLCANIAPHTERLQILGHVLGHRHFRCSVLIPHLNDRFVL